ncbi:hypothetical protein IAU60_003510 [Kwoniella sp. DSM 27419]
MPPRNSGRSSRGTQRTAGSPSAAAPSPQKKARTASSKTKARSIRGQRSIWTSTDDWDTLLADSALSTSSVSLRPPRLRGLPSLIKCCTDAIARGFKRLWESSEEPGQGFKIAWNEVPDHLKEGVRDQVFRWWGGYLTLKIISETFLIPPHLYLPGELLPAIASTDRLKDLIPSTRRDAFTSLTLSHASSASDVGVQALIHHLPNLERINLKGCTAVSSKTVRTVVQRCKRLKRINLKGTKVAEADVALLLGMFHDQLEGFKVDNVAFEDLSATFASAPYPSLTHLCLPGAVLNSPAQDFRARARIYGHTIGYPDPRPTPGSSPIQWSSLSDAFPRLSNLALPGLLVPEGTVIDLAPGLVKLSLGDGGPPVPMQTLIGLLDNQTASLKSLHLGHIRPQATASGSADPRAFEQLGEVLSRCQLESFRLVAEPGGSKDAMCDAGMSRFSHLVYGPGLAGKWRQSLKRLTLSVPQPIQATSFFPMHESAQSVDCPLETLELPSAHLVDTAAFARALTGFKALRALDLSNTTIADDDMKVILESCQLLSRIDLTSCRGVNVRHRRNIFKALQG